MNPHRQLPHSLRVNVRSTSSPSGVYLQSDVFCARLDGHVPLANCTRCEHNLCVECRDSGVFVRCALERGALERVELVDGHVATASVRDAMAHDVLCVSPYLSLTELVRLLLDHGSSGAPVVDPDGRPLGIVTKSDVVRVLESDGTLSRGRRCDASDSGIEVALSSPEVLEHGTVADIMTTLTLGVSDSASIARAAALMAYEGVHRILVLSQEGKVVGLLSSIDVLRWLAKQAGYVMAAPRGHKA